METGKKVRTVRIILSLLLLVVLVFNIVSCAVEVKAYDLMEGITPSGAEGREADDEFTDAMSDFAFKLFASSLTENENSLISPLSVMVALAMTANGAAGETLAEMEALLGGGMTIEKLNEYLKTYVEGLPSDSKYKLSLANSIWFRDDVFSVEKDFLQTNANYYKAAAYKAPFDDKLIADVNNWVKENTDGLIDKILESIDPNTVMYLINALVFDAEWENKYEKKDITDNYDFTNINGNVKKVSMMKSLEGRYLILDNATGFAKYYSGGKYSFVALLPDEGVKFYDFIKSLDGKKFAEALKNAEQTEVSAYLPAFEYKYNFMMNEALAALGMPTAFNQDKADFSKLGSGDLYIGSVIHKTYIQVDANGTKAAAVTKVGINLKSAPAEPEKKVILDRPFVYVIVDNTTNLPVFIGTVIDFK